MTATQGTAEWFAARCGKITASRAKDVLERLKNGKRSAKGTDYMVELATERMTGEALTHFTSTAMAWGTDQEANARREYEAVTGNLVTEVGFQCFDGSTFGCSPDGLVGDDGLVEFKCPFNSTVHIMTILGGTIPEEHIPQVQAQLAVTGRDWCDFASYDPRMPDGLRLFVVRVPRDEAYITALFAEVKVFEAEVAELVTRLQAIQARNIA
jgi:predicted phage-related endonuclease